MRISDWSSDVCSSDLVAHQRPDIEDAAVGIPAIGATAIAQHAVDRTVEIDQVRENMPILHRTGDIFTGNVGPAGAIPLRGFLLELPQLYQHVDRRRSEERRVGKECVSTCRSRWSPGH